MTLDCWVNKQDDCVAARDQYPGDFESGKWYRHTLYLWDAGKEKQLTKEDADAERPGILTPKDKREYLNKGIIYPYQTAERRLENYDKWYRRFCLRIDKRNYEIDPNNKYYKAIYERTKNEI